MRSGYAHIVILLDRSGSMESIKSDTIGGFNRFLSEQQRVPGEATLTLVQFDDELETLCRFRSLGQVSPLGPDTYVTRNCTALLDAMGKVIRTTGEDLAFLAEDQRPDRVLFVVITDGMENSSKEFKKDQIRQMIKLQEEKYNWKFVFLGANMDAVAEGGTIGVSVNSSMTFAPTAKGIRNVFATMSGSTAAYRCCVSAVDAAKMDYITEEDRFEQNKAGI